MLTQRRLGARSREMALALCGEAVAMQAAGDTPGALALFQEAYNLLEDNARQCSCEFASVCSYLGIIAYEKGDHEETLRYCKRALACGRDILSPSHLNLAGAHEIITNYHTALGHRSAAAAARHAASSIVRRSQVACAGPGCKRRLRENGAPLDVCVKCRRTFYCGKACQTADWKREGGHKAECKALIAEPAGGVTGEGVAGVERRFAMDSLVIRGL